MVSKATLASLCLLGHKAQCLLQTPVGRQRWYNHATKRLAFISRTAAPHGHTKTSRLSPTMLSSAASSNEQVHISIEYCSGCQWMLRSTWLASELFTTFVQETKLASITLLPKSPPLSPGGIFRVISKVSDSDVESVLWDRSWEGRFPEAKEVKQAVRDVVNPGKDLGHSEKKDDAKAGINVECVECKENEETNKKTTEAAANNPSSLQDEALYPPAFYENNMISIEFSTGLTISSQENQMHKAIMYTNELLSMVYERNAWWKENKELPMDTIQDLVPASLDGVTLIPNRETLGVLVSNTLVTHTHSSCTCKH